MSLQTISFSDAVNFSNKLNRKSYFSNPFYLYHNCLSEEKNGEILLYEKQKVDNEYPLIFLPTNLENFTNKIIGTCFEEDITVIKKTHKIKSSEVLGHEYFYSTKEWTDLEGSKFKDIRKRISKFQKEHSLNVLNDYSVDKIKSFLNEWADEKRKKEVPESTKFFFEQELKESIENLNLLGNYENKKIFVEEKGELIGFTIFIPTLKNLWVGLMQKTKHGVTGLPQYLYHLKAKEIAGENILATGAEADDPDLKAFKESLRPCEVKTIYLVRIGDKL